MVVDGVSAKFFPIQGPKARFRFWWQFALRLARDTRRFDVLHIHSLYNFPGLIAAYFCRQLGIPYIVRPHGTLDPYHYRQRRMLKAPYEALFERRNLARAAAVHFTSDEELRLAQRTGWSFRGVVLPLGVDLPPADSGARAMADSLWPHCKGRRIVLFLGRVDEKKGLDFLIPAFASLTDERPDLHLLVAEENDRWAQGAWLGAGLADRGPSHLHRHAYRRRETVRARGGFNLRFALTGREFWGGGGRSDGCRAAGDRL